MDKYKNNEMIDDKDLDQVNGGMTQPIWNENTTAKADVIKKKYVRKGQGGNAANEEQC